MASHNNEGINGSPESPRDAGLDKSLVGKLVSGLISNTPLSKWFGKDASTSSPSPSVVRRRADLEDDDDSSFSIQPPIKRPKIPSNCYSDSQTPSNSNNIKNKPFGGFPEPQAGPSGVKFKTYPSLETTITNSFSSHDPLNGDESDSGESTSGYSSVPRATAKNTEVEPQKCQEDNKTPKSRSLFSSTADTNQSRSLFSERSLSPSMNTSLSSRRPAFNASTFGSPTFMDKTITTKRIMNSPFYSGHTIYGGASAYTRKFAKSFEDSQQSIRSSIQIKPVNNNKTTTSENTTLSKTARRILSTLEQYSTPISDAKKIPITPKRQGILSKYIGAAPYSVKERKKAASNTELQVPTIPELLQMKQKERLQNSTENVRQIANSSKSSLNTNKTEYKLRVEGGDNTLTKHSNKMKSNISAVRQKLQVKQQEESLPEVNLPKVSLPITTLPKFDFVLAPPQSTSPKTTITHTMTSTNVITKTKTVTIQETDVDDKKGEMKEAETKTQAQYQFSKPLIIAEDHKAVPSINCFKFSKPLNSDVKKSDEIINKSTGSEPSPIKPKNNGEKVDKVNLPSLDKFIQKNKWECPTCLVRNESDKFECVACNEPKPLKENPTDEWKCKTCWIKNKKDVDKCVACKTPKVAPVTTTTSSSFGDQFKPPSDTWSCPTCMINNKKDALKCAACETPKPGASAVKEKSTTATFNFGIKPLDWQCKECWVNNKPDAKKCCACETPKDADSAKKDSIKGFGDAFKAKGGEWECASCLVRNKSTTDTCVCCGVVKAGSQVNTDKIKEADDKKPVNSFNFGIDKAGPQFKFGIPTELKDKPIAVSSSSIGIFGNQTVTSSSSSGSSTLPIIFGATTASASSNTTTTPSFSFGIPAAQASKAEATIATNSTISTNPILKTTSSNPLLKPTEKLPEEVKPASAEFTFGLSNNNLSDKSNNSTSTTKTTFEFKPAPINGDVNNKDISNNTNNTNQNTNTSLFESKLTPITTSNAISSMNTITTTPSATPMFQFDPKPALPIVASTSQTTLPTATLFKFGSPSQNPNKRSLEEATPAAVSTEPSINGFGSAPKVAAFAPPQTTLPVAATTVKPFTFAPVNTNTSEPAPKIPQFSFGQSDSKPAAPNFNFGSQNTTAQTCPGSSGFNFTMTTVPSSGFNFGTKPDSFGGFNTGAKNGTFNFGTNPNNNNQKAVFTFGANQSQQGSVQGGFNFGAATPAAPAPGAFSFTRTPTINFTEGAAATGQPQRKFRKAVRRTQPR